MKKIISAALPLVVFLAYASPSFAITIACPGGFEAVCNLGSNDLGRIVGVIIAFMFIIAVVIALIYLVYGGIKWITSGGDKTGVENARNHIIAAVIGLVVVFLSYFILTLLLQLFHITLNNITVPSI